jgi:hypothetical protein
MSDSFCPDLRLRCRTLLLWALVLAGTAPVSTQTARGTAPLSTQGARPGTEIGKVGQAEFRIDVPQQWTKKLVIYCHGYSRAGRQRPSIGSAPGVPATGRYREAIRAVQWLDRGARTCTKCPAKSVSLTGIEPLVPSLR